jgi:hypothetical protein
MTRSKGPFVDACLFKQKKVQISKIPLLDSPALFFFLFCRQVAKIRPKKKSTA